MRAMMVTPSPMGSWETITMTMTLIAVGCKRQFANNTALNKYLANSSKHTRFLGDGDDDNDPYCIGCKRQFANMTTLNNHLAYSSKHGWCFDCSRDFGSDAVLEQVCFVNAFSLSCH
jgi:hypothetical protein